MVTTRHDVGIVRRINGDKNGVDSRQVILVPSSSSLEHDNRCYYTTFLHYWEGFEFFMRLNKCLACSNSVRKCVSGSKRRNFRRRVLSNLSIVPFSGSLMSFTLHSIDSIQTAALDTAVHLNYLQPIQHNSWKQVMQIHFNAMDYHYPSTHWVSIDPNPIATFNQTSWIKAAYIYRLNCFNFVLTLLNTP